jgi:predicted porin
MAQSTVEIYGRANLGLENWRATGSSVAGGDMKSRNRVFDSGSRLGFRVNEALGGGLRAFVVMETGVNIDSGSQSGQSGTTNASSGTWASRDSYVGIGGGWGDVRFGRQSIFWSNGVIAQTGANYIDTAADGLTTGGHVAVAIPVARQSNVVSYNSPTIGGFNASLSYAPSDQEGSAFTGTGQERGSIWGLTGRYTTGALRAQFDWAKRANVANANDIDITGWKVGVGWAYAPGSQVSFIHERLENKNILAANGLVTAGLAAAGDDPEVKINLINWEHMLGQWQLMAQYGWSSKVKGLTGAVGNDDTEVKAYTLAVKYFLSKRTGVYLSLNGTRNEDNAWGDATSGGGMSSGPGGTLTAANRGADIRIIGLGFHHNF